MTLEDWGTSCPWTQNYGMGQVERLCLAPLCALSVEARCQADLQVAGRLSAGAGRCVPLPVTLVSRVFRGQQGRAAVFHSRWHSSVNVCLGSPACLGLTAGTSGPWACPRAMPPAAGEAAAGPGEVLSGGGFGGSTWTEANPRGCPPEDRAGTARRKFTW